MAGFEIKSCTGCTPDEKYFSVCNYDSLNLVQTYGFETKAEAIKGKPQYIVGTWQPKGTKASNNAVL